MAELSDILQTNIIPHKKAIHDCVDTGNDLALSASTEIDFPVDCAGRDYKTTSGLWDNSTSLIKDSIDNGVLYVKYKMVLNGSANDILTLRIYVPHPTFGDIEVDSQELVLYKNNIDTLFTGFSLLYNGTDSEATQYGFKVTINPSANMTLKARSILITD